MKMFFKTALKCEEWKTKAKQLRRKRAPGEATSFL